MVYIALILVGGAFAGACLLFIARSPTGPGSAARRWSGVALAFSAISAALFRAAGALPGSGDLWNGSLELLALLLWIASAPIELIAAFMISRAVQHRDTKSLWIACLLLTLAIASTASRALVGYP